MHSRPLSPHLQVYRWQITMALSILHRFSGVAISLGLIGMVFWLLALSQGAAVYARWFGWLGSVPGKVVLFLFSLSLVYHLCNGLRHLWWDMGKGLTNEGVTRSGLLTVAATFVLTALVWLLAGGAA